MKTIKELKKTSMVLNREDMKQLKGGRPINCRTSGGHSFTNESGTLMASWAAFWKEAGYSVSCSYVYFT